MEKKTDFTVKQKYSAFGQDEPFVSRLRRVGLVLGNRCILLVGRVRISIFSSVGVIGRKWHAKLSENKSNFGTMDKKGKLREKMTLEIGFERETLEVI